MSATADLSVDETEIDFIMRGLNLLHEHGDLTEEQERASAMLAFKLGAAAHDVIAPVSDGRA